MRDCIFTSHCIETSCDKSCPAFVETNYLLERNNLINNSAVYKASPATINEVDNVINNSNSRLGVYVVPPNSNTSDYANIFTYVSICKYWKGSQLHVSVYHLRYSYYIDQLKKSWASKSNQDELEYSEIWYKKCKVLIVSNFDYMNFGDFESQTLLSLIQERQDNNLTTILVSPPINTLVSTKSSIFFNTLKKMMKLAAKEVRS